MARQLPTALYDGIHDLFLNASTNIEFRHATFEAAHRLMNTYFGSAPDFTVSEEGPVSTAIEVPDYDTIAAEETCIFVARGIPEGYAQPDQSDARPVHCIMLAVNAVPDSGNVVEAATRKIGQVARAMGAGRCFGIAVVRENVAFVEKIA
jgi:hypothetical protein